MGRKRKLTPEEKAEKKRRRAINTTVFVGGKQKRVKRPLMIEGLSGEEFIERNGGPIALHQAGLWHLIDEEVADSDEKEDTDDLFGPALKRKD